MFAALFPGQGSQSVGMLAQLYQAYPVVREVFAEAADVLSYNLWDKIEQGSDEELRQTSLTQPAMFVADIACYRAFLDAGGRQPAIGAGHSLGEYAALTAAGAFAFSDALGLVALRGQLMAGAAPDGVGGMAAVLGLEDQKLIDLCAALAGDDVLEAVNFNAPGQVVISGHVHALERALPELKTAGAKRAMLLPVSVANHSALMKPASAPLSERICATKLQSRAFPVVQNFTAQAAASDSALIDALCSHVVGPVYWTQSIAALSASGAQCMIEFGPGKVLSGLVRRIDRSIKVLPVEDQATLEAAVAASAEV